MGFVHLHCHSEYSLLDGASRIKQMVAYAKDMGMPALALTDHGVMYGAIEFFTAAKAAGIKPVIGCEVYVAPVSRHSKSGRKDDGPNHLVLLAKDLTGYRNIMRLVSLGYLEGYYYKPRVDTELLAAHSEGLIALSACLAGKVPQMILNNRFTEARDAAIELNEIFGAGNFYLEIQDHGIEEQKICNEYIIKLSEELNIPLVVTNDSHYTRKEDSKAHDVLLCIQTGSMLGDTKRMKFDSEEFYLKTEEQMRALFPDRPDAADNTLKIAEACNLDLDLGRFHLPHYEVPDGYTLDSYLGHLCRERLASKYGDGNEEAAKRLDYELSVINDMGFPGYFLIVWDFVRAAKDMGIAVGPGRGSAAGSIVAFLLGITNVDPLKYGLLFERFLNPARKTMPDIDIDFDDERRPEIIEYVSQKYGDDHVAQIITFGTMKGRAATRDAGRVLGFPYGQIDRIAKLITEDTIELSLEKNAELKELYAKDEEARTVLDNARALEGLSRQDSIHAAGVVISKEALTEYTPIQRKGDAEMVTQYSMESITKIGLLKMDFLGLRTLTVLSNAVKIIERTRGLSIDLDALPLDDESTYRLLGRGDTIGVFQLESSGMRSLIRDLKPSCFEDLIAILALFRPGPLGSGMVKDFIDRKHGRKPIEYFHPSLESILKETYGILVYQEQVMQLAGTLSGFSMAEADALRSAISKKNEDVLQEQKEKFVQGAKDISAERAGEIFDLVLHFAGYGFNKSHSTAYAFLSYQAAYLKSYYPAEYMTAVLSSVSDDKDKVAVYVNDCRTQNIKVLSPDVNESWTAFTAVGDHTVRFGLGAVRNVGSGVIEDIIGARNAGPFASFEDFCGRVDLTGLNKRTIESLIKAGAFDSLGLTRKNLIDHFEAVVDSALREQKDRQAGQFNLFEAMAGDGGEDEADGGGNSFTTSLLSLPGSDEEMDKGEMLAFEKEMLGLYVSDHPLQGLQELLTSESDCSVAALRQKEDGSWQSIAGMISRVVPKTTKKGSLMYFLTVEDLEGSIEIIVFSNLAEQAKELIKEDQLVKIRGRVDHKEDEVKFIGQAIEALNAAASPKKKILHITLSEGIHREALDGLSAVLQRNRGDFAVVIDVGSNGHSKRMRVGEGFFVNAGNDLMAEILEILPRDSVKMAFARES